MVARATLEVIRDKLASPTEDVRIVALVHARAHGDEGKPLAPLVARCFEDDSEAVAWWAMGTFMAIGAGAGDAVPVLRAQLTKGEPAMLVRRAISALGRIGAPAVDAVPDLLARCDGDDSALAALVAIAPEHPRVRELVRADILAGHTRWLPLMPELADDLLASVAGRADREAVQLLAKLVEHRPQAIERAIELLAVDDRTVLVPALHIVQRRAALDDATCERIATLSNAGGELGRLALATLARFAPARALPLARAAIEGLHALVPVGGEARHPGYLLATAATIAAAAGDRAAGERLLAWIDTAATRARDDDDVNWYVIADVLAAIATLVEPPRADRAALIMAALSERYSDRDESGVLDFHRALREYAAGRGEPFWDQLATLGVPREDPYERDERPPELPDFPPEAPPRPPLRLAAAPAASLHEIKTRRAAAAALAGIALDAEPAAIVDAIAAVVVRARREQRPLGDGEQRLLGLLWGDAVTRAAGWRWRALVDDDVTSLAIASPDETVACDIDAFIPRQLAKRESTIVLVFNMIVAGRLPEAAAGRVVTIG